MFSCPIDFIPRGVYNKYSERRKPRTKGKRKMKKYILKSGRVVTEEQLEDFYRAFTTTTFNERDYKAWKYDKLAASELKFAE